jgi:hypothetical protein
VDDLSFSLSTGLENLSGTSLTGKCYPNPSSDIINIPLNENVSGEFTLQVFDTHGTELKHFACHSSQTGYNVFQFSVEDLKPGLYIYSLNGQNTNYAGKFTVNR